MSENEIYKENDKTEYIRNMVNKLKDTLNQNGLHKYELRYLIQIVEQLYLETFLFASSEMTKEGWQNFYKDRLKIAKDIFDSYDFEKNNKE